MSRHNAGLRLTPSNSPYFKSTTPRSPVKAQHRNEEPGLQLKKVIGTTTTSSLGFDALPSAKCFAYIAGAAAVVATVEDDLSVKQRFFRARPSSATSGKEGTSQWPSSPTPTEPRHRALGHVRGESLGGSPLGTSARDWSDSPSGKTTTAKDRVKAVTSVALSPNGKWVALGETGYKPRILIFSLAEGASEKPVCALSEHTFGVHALRFSPDSRYLASLGTVNDGFLYVWSIDDRTVTASLYASNKCTVLINAVAWMGTALVTAGLRFVKVWRPDEDSVTEEKKPEVANGVLTPRHRADNRSSDFGNSILGSRQKVLAGKNSLLGDLLDANFVSATSVTSAKMVLCAEGGEICILDDASKVQTLDLIASVSFRVTAARLDREDHLIVVGSSRQSRSIRLSEIEMQSSDAGRRPRGQTISPVKTASGGDSAVVATAGFGNGVVVELDSEHGVLLCDRGSAKVKTLSAHEDAVLGVQCLRSQHLPLAAFLSFSGNGTVNFWTADGQQVAAVKAPIDSTSDEYGQVNELKAVAAIIEGSLLVCGDKYGTLTVLEPDSGRIVSQARAHSAEILALATTYQHSLELVASSSRDRMVQVFNCRYGALDLVQTLDEHAGAVSAILFANDGKHLLSISADRTIVIRERILRQEENPTSLAYVMLRAITLKSSPTAMCLAPGGDEIYVSTTDRCIAKYSMSTGQASSNFKCSDSEGGEAAVMSKILLVSGSKDRAIIAGISSSDKSLRLYTEDGTLIARDWGHTEGVTDAAWLPAYVGGDGDAVQSDDQRIVTVAADSTMFIWSTESSKVSQQPTGEMNGSAGPALTATKASMAAPLRKVISHTELSRFRQAPSQENSDLSSPTAAQCPAQPASPQRLRKKTSRASVSQTPRLEPAFRANTAGSSRRSSLMRQRSPSPPSPRNVKKRDQMRRQSMANLRSKSTENVTKDSLLSSSNNSSGFGSLTASTESASRSLRAYRKKLTSTSAESIAPEALRELERELKLTARALGERSQGKSLDETSMAKLLDQASEKIVGLLDERIKERVESEMKKSNEGSPAGGVPADPAARVGSGADSDIDAIAGALAGAGIGT